jgi:hypothetical protein
MEAHVQTHGPITVRRLSALTGMKKSKVNAILYNDLRFVKTERSPLSHVNTRAVWSWSPAPVVRPSERPRINSRNKHVRRTAAAESIDKSH